MVQNGVTNMFLGPGGGGLNNGLHGGMQMNVSNVFIAEFIGRLIVL
jgi:hypothetical protein